VILRISALTIDEANPQHLALATAYGVGSEVAGGSVYESTDAGQSWTKLADTPTVVNTLNISGGGVYAATEQGLVQYREPTIGTASSPLNRLRSLADPSGIQVLILALTIILAGLILIGRIEWVLGRKEARPAAR
jgi:carbohydrate-binding DOMON domain-containing protein